MNNKLLSYSSFGVLVAILVLVAIPFFSPKSSVRYGGVTNYNNIQLQPEAANDGIDLIVAKDFAGTNKFQVATSGQVVAASGTTYLSNPVIRDRNGSILTVTDSVVTSTINLTGAQLCQNPRINVEFRTTTGTLTIASSSDLTAECLTTAGDKFGFPITLFNASGTGNFNVVAGVSSSLVSFSVGTSSLSGLRATTTIVASSSAHLWIEFMGASSTGGNWLIDTLNVMF